MDATATGDKDFEVSCGTSGEFERNSSEHVCKAVTCNSAPVVKNSDDVTGTFYYTDVANYTCKTGFTVDGTPGGLGTFSTSCQATGVFSAALTCNAVRCGQEPSYPNTDLVSNSSEKLFEDQVQYKCQSGHSYDQQ